MEKSFGFFFFSCSPQTQNELCHITLWRCDGTLARKKNLVEKVNANVGHRVDGTSLNQFALPISLHMQNERERISKLYCFVVDVLLQRHVVTERR